MMKLAAVQQKAGKNPDPFYLDAGRHLYWLRQGPHDREEWEQIVRGECRRYAYWGKDLDEFAMSPRRADELIAIATGKTTLKELRKWNSARAKKSRKTKYKAGKPDAEGTSEGVE
jgi:hypothetical protein